MIFDKYKTAAPDHTVTENVGAAMTDADESYFETLSALPDEKRIDMRVWRTVGTVAAVVAAVVAVSAWLLIGLGMRNARVSPDDGEGALDVEIKTNETNVPANAAEDTKKPAEDGSPALPDDTQKTAEDGAFRVTCKDGDVTPHETVQAFVNAYAAGKPCTLVYEDGAGTITCVIDGGGAVKKTTEGTPDGQSYSVFPNDSHHASKLMLDRDAHEYKLFLYGSTAGINSNYGKTDDFNLDFGKADYIKYSGKNNSRVFDSAKSAPVPVGENGEYVSGAESVLYYFRQKARGKYAAMTVNGHKYCYRNGSDKSSDGSACTLSISYNKGNNTVNLVCSRRSASDVIANDLLFSLPPYDAMSSRLTFCPGSDGYSVFREDVSAAKPMTEEQMSRLEAAIDAEGFPAIALDIYDYEQDVTVCIGEYNITSFKDSKYKNVLSVYPYMSAGLGYGPCSVSDAFIKALNEIADELVKPTEQTDGYENPLDPDRLFSYAEMSPPQQPVEIDKEVEFPKTRKMKYAVPPKNGFSFSAADKKRNIAPEGATLTLDEVVSSVFACRKYKLGYYTDENGNKYGFNASGKLVEFLPYNSGDLSRPACVEYTPYSPEFDKQLANEAAELAHALFGDALDEYIEVRYDYPDGTDFSAWNYTCVNYAKRRGFETLYNVQVLMSCDHTAYVHVDPVDDLDIDYGIYDDLTERNLRDLLRKHTGSNCAFDDDEFVFDFLFQYGDHLYQRICIYHTDDTDGDATHVYYYRVD